MSKEQKSDVFANMPRPGDDFTNPDALWEPYKRKTYDELEEEKRQKKTDLENSRSSKFSYYSNDYGMLTGGLFLTVIGLFMPFIGIFLVIGGLVISIVWVSRLSKNQEQLKVIEDGITQEVDKEIVESLEKLLNEKFDKYLHFPKGGFTEAEILDSKLYTQQTIKSGVNMFISQFDDRIIRHSLVLEYKVQSDKATGKQVSSLYEITYKDLCPIDFYMKTLTDNNVTTENIVDVKDVTLNAEYTTYVIEDRDEVTIPDHLMELMKIYAKDYKGNVEFSYINGKLYIKILYRDTIILSSKTDSTMNFNYGIYFSHQIDDLVKLLNYK